METSWVIGGSVAIAAAVVLIAIGIWYIFKSPSLNSVLSGPGFGGLGPQIKSVVGFQSLSQAQLQKLKEEEQSNNIISTVLIIMGILVGGPAGIFLVSQGVLRR